MTLNRFEKVAGRGFRERAQKVLDQELRECGDSAPCAPDVAIFRHECGPWVKGRTRSIALQDCTLASPEIWVTWNGASLEVITEDEAEVIVATGRPVEYEVILAGKFSFTWKHGKCGKCGLQVMSREGIFRDARPRDGMSQEDLASMTGGWARPIVDREMYT